MSAGFDVSTRLLTPVATQILAFASFRCISGNALSLLCVILPLIEWQAPDLSAVRGGAETDDCLSFVRDAYKAGTLEARAMSLR